jgi:hypothetical protein
VKIATDHLYTAAELCTPKFELPSPERVEVDGRTVLVVTVPEGISQVYGVEGHYLAREGSHRRALTPDELRALLSRRGLFAFDRLLVPGARRDHLDRESHGCLNLRERRAGAPNSRDAIRDSSMGLLAGCPSLLAQSAPALSGGISVVLPSPLLQLPPVEGAVTGHRTRVAQLRDGSSAVGKLACVSDFALLEGAHMRAHLACPLRHVSSATLRLHRGSRISSQEVCECSRIPTNIREQWGTTS